jgi:hypothetical protein
VGEVSVFDSFLKDKACFKQALSDGSAILAFQIAARFRFN